VVQIPDRGSPEIVLVDPGGRRTTAVLCYLCGVEAVASCLPILVEGEVWVPVEGYLVTSTELTNGGPTGRWDCPTGSLRHGGHC